MSLRPATSDHGGLRSAAFLAVAFGAYLALSIVLWWHVWSTHPTGVTLCGCEDPSLSVWFLEWPAYALSHGHNPFYSTALFHPAGINLLSNTGMLAIGVPLVPVTWLFGPVAALNVASTLAPALTALAMFWLLRRWVCWAPAAFVGGLAFGFSPFVFVNMAVAHLNLVVLVLVPLIVACLDELLVRQRRRPLIPGVLLGLLVVVQFFVSTEVLTMLVLCSGVGLVLLVAYGALDHGHGHGHELASRAPHAMRGLGIATSVAVLLLAYPMWFALDGPAHLSGLVWPSIRPGSGGIALSSLWRLRFTQQAAVRFFGGYQGPALVDGEYLGIGMLVVLVAGVVAWRRDRRLWFFGTLGVVTVVLSLGIQSYWTPWRVLARIPLVQNLLPGTIMVMTTLCVAVMLGVLVDLTYAWVHEAVAHLAARVPSRRSRSRPEVITTPGFLAGTLPRILATVVALAVAAVATVPVATAIAPNVPLTTEGVAVPRWFTEVGSRLPAGQVVLTFPPPITGGSAMTWQAVDGLRFSLATGAGPESIPRRAGKERTGQGVISAAASLFATLAPATDRNVEAVRQALAGWGVTDVVVVDPSELVPPADRVAGTAWALGFFTLAIGRPPLFTDGAWVWSGVEVPAALRTIATGAFAGCTTTERYLSPSRDEVPDCVMAASLPA